MKKILSTARFFAKASPFKELTVSAARGMATLSQYKYETLRVSSPKEFVYHVEINRPEKRNAMNLPFWKEMVTCFEQISLDPDCRSIVFSGAGKMFSAGIDIQALTGTMSPSESDDVGRKAFRLRSVVPKFQDSFTALEKCLKPVIIAVHSGCIGAGINLICAGDIRYCSQDAWFQVKELELGIVADVGVLQRLPKIVGNDSLVRELCYTARQMKADEAKELGLVSRVFPDHQSLLAGAIETAEIIVSKSPVAVQGTKLSLLFARDHSVPDSLNQVALLNQGLLQGEDVLKAVAAMMTKEKPIFSKL